ncbi:MAG: hypothetical protein AAGF12_23240 [Myxococcota bacterium]
MEVAVLLVASAMAGTAVAVRGLYGFYSEGAVLRRQMRRVQRQRIGDAVDGSEVKVCGVVDDEGPLLEAPLTGRRCVAWTIEVWEGDAGPDAPPLVRDAGLRDFLLYEESGRGLVRLERVRFLLTQKSHFRSGPFTLPSERAEAYLDQCGVRPVLSTGIRKRLRFCEAIVRPGDRVTVCGAAHWVRDPDPRVQARVSYRAAARRLVIDAPDGGFVLVSNDEAA